MGTTRLRLLAVAALVVACGGEASPRGAASAQAPSPAAFPAAVPESLGLSTARLQSLADTMARWVRAGDVVGAELLILKDRQTVWHEAVGWKDRERAIPYERNTIARIRSMTKPFVGMSVQMLAEEGRVRLEDPVAAYLPSWDNERSRGITIEQLLYHRGGFTQPGYPTPLRSYHSLREAVDATGRAGPQHEPGSRYFYSDAGSATLGAVAAQVSGMPVETFIETRILQPLGLHDTFTMLTMDDPRRPRVSSTYSRTDPNGRFEKYWENTEPQQMVYFRASGGMYSTPRDYARFLALWMDFGRVEETRLLRRETVMRALRGRPTGGSYEYGMQWQTFPRLGSSEDGRAVFGHGGSDGTIAVAHPGEDVMVLYFTQSRGGNTTARMVDLAWEALGLAN